MNEYTAAYFTSDAVAGQIGSSLYQQSSIAEEAFQDDEGVTGAAREAGGTLSGEQDLDAVNLQISVDARSLALLYLTGLAVVLLAVGISSITVMRLKPREILSKMS